MQKRSLAKEFNIRFRRKMITEHSIMEHTVEITWHACRHNPSLPGVGELTILFSSKGVRNKSVTKGFRVCFENPTEHIQASRRVFRKNHEIFFDT
jgi:hypothetical protein